MDNGNARIPAPRRGWSSQELPVVATTDSNFWSVFDMTITLGLTKGQVACLITLANLQRAGKRHNGSRRRHVPVYRAQEVLDAFDKVAPLLTTVTG